MSDKFWIILNDNTPRVKYPTRDKAEAAATKTSRHCRGEKFYIMGCEKIIHSDIEIHIESTGGTYIYPYGKVEGE